MSLRVKSPLEKIIKTLKDIAEIGDLDLAEPIRKVQKIAEELESEKAFAIANLIAAPNIELVKFSQGRVYQIKRLQRDFQRD